MKKQLILIHGGMTFDNRKDYLTWLKNLEIDLDFYRREGWHGSLRKKLGKNFDVLLARMPNATSAKYQEWEIIFDKMAPLLEENVILIGHSLGAIFLAKYLSENQFPKKIRATFLIAPPHDDKKLHESLADFNLPKSLAGLAEQGGRIFLYHSQDDPTVPYSHSLKYKKSLPKAVLKTFKNRGHFNQPEFPELVREIKGLCK